jgi:hypothetical protein
MTTTTIAAGGRPATAVAVMAGGLAIPKDTPRPLAAAGSIAAKPT